MIRVNIVVEGQTEETFVRDVLYNYFVEKNIFLNSIVVRTSKTCKGGGSSYGKIKNDIKIKCKQDATSYVTTMLDYYALPTDFPGKANVISGELYNLIEQLESNFSIDIAEKNFIPNLIVHEFESLLFSDLNAFDDLTEVNVITELKSQASKFDTPEHINNHQNTAPSKRILKLFPKYQKIYHGSLISSKIGIDAIRKKCPHFDKWLKKLEKLGENIK